MISCWPRISPRLVKKWLVGFWGVLFLCKTLCFDLLQLMIVFLGYYVPNSPLCTFIVVWLTCSLSKKCFPTLEADFLSSCTYMLIYVGTYVKPQLRSPFPDVMIGFLLPFCISSWFSTSCIFGAWIINLGASKFVLKLHHFM